LRQEQGTHLGAFEGRHAHAPVRVELPAASRAAQGVHRHAGRGEGIHVAVQRAQRDLQPPRQITAGEPAPGLQKKDDREEA
jgi:hypothetical protein